MGNEIVENPYNLKVEYHFEFEDGENIAFKVEKDILEKKPRHYSSKRYKWEELEFHQCEQCPLSSSEYPYCPAAISITDIIEYFSKKASFSNCKCTVRMPDKTISGEKPIQDVLYSLIGVRMATSACPFLSRFRPLARFHEPFSTPFYTMQRIMSSYLLEQFFKNKREGTGEFNFSGLKDFYSHINIVNSKMALRLAEAEVMDATPNSIMILSLFGTSVTFFFDDYLEILQKLYE
ncbi:MAG: hypothetical protein JW774_08395 [Candidatus Aureabacteria bacterium]|nr:hypothetical protein [Candidatus Auribacterota bacterium]